MGGFLNSLRFKGPKAAWEDEGLNAKERLQRMMELMRTDNAVLTREYVRAIRTCYAVGGMSAWLGDASIHYFKDMAAKGVPKEELVRLLVFYEDVVDRKWRW
jgi:hypothetical protein